MKYSEFFNNRKNTFEKIYEFILNNIDNKKTFNIVELGTSRSFVTGRIENRIEFWNPDKPQNWDWGAGCFTKTFADNLEGYNFKLYTIDPCPNANKVVKTIIGNNKNVEIIKAYSTDFLNNIDFKIDLLYMDHMESGEEACKLHLSDIKLIIEKDLMSKKSLILIDDTPPESGFNSKGLYSIPYLINKGYKKVIHEYQVLLSVEEEKEEEDEEEEGEEGDDDKEEGEDEELEAEDEEEDEDVII